MGKYSIQASEYARNAREIEDDLTKIIDRVDNLDKFFNEKFSKVDLVTKEVISRNEIIRTKVKEIIKKINNISSTLKREAKIIDDQIAYEEELARKKQAEQAANSNMDASNLGGPSAYNFISNEVK